MEKHNLIDEFPEFREKIHHLKMENNHFKKLFDQYDEVHDEIYRINQGVENTSDAYAHQLKAKLLHLKDELFMMLSVS